MLIDMGSFMETMQGLDPEDKDLATRIMTLFMGFDQGVRGHILVDSLQAALLEASKRPSFADFTQIKDIEDHLETILNPS